MRLVAISHESRIGRNVAMEFSPHVSLTVYSTSIHCTLYAQHGESNTEVMCRRLRFTHCITRAFVWCCVFRLLAVRFMRPDVVPSAEWIPLEAPSGRIKDRMRVQVTTFTSFDDFAVSMVLIYCITRKI